MSLSSSSCHWGSIRRLLPNFSEAARGKSSKWMQLQCCGCGEENCETALWLTAEEGALSYSSILWGHSKAAEILQRISAIWAFFRTISRHAEKTHLPAHHRPSCPEKKLVVDSGQGFWKFRVVHLMVILKNKLLLGENCLPVGSDRNSQQAEAWMSIWIIFFW